MAPKYNDCFTHCFTVYLKQLILIAQIHVLQILEEIEIDLVIPRTIKCFTLFGHATLMHKEEE